MASPNSNCHTDNPDIQDKNSAVEDSAALLLILGNTTSGGKFRPSDWCDRLHGTLHTLKDDECYEDIKDMVHLVHYQNNKCIVVANELKNINVLVYNFFVNFAKNNKLTIVQLSEEEWLEHQQSPY